MITKKTHQIFLATFFCCAPLSANDFQFSGYLKSYLLAQDKIDVAQAPPEFSEALSANTQSQNALRLMGTYLSNNSHIELHYEAQPLYFSNAQVLDTTTGIGSTIAIGANRYRYDDINPILHQINDNALVLQNLDRLNYQYSSEHADITVGRQVISFGSARFINPTDIFIPFNIQTLNQEYRVGIDAIRYQVALGDFSTLDAGMIIGHQGKKENSALFLRTENAINGNDIEATFIYLDDAWLAGGGIERAIGDFGFWFETAYMYWHNEQNQDPTFDNDFVITAEFGESLPSQQNYWRSSIGADYSLTDSVIVMLEYHYNGAGSNDPSDYQNNYKTKPYQKAGVFLLGQHYVIPAISWMASPLLTVTSSAFFNVDDQSTFLTLSGETGWSDNLYSDFGAYLTTGKSFAYQQASQQINFGSEFGGYPLSLYASLRYYF